MTAFDIYTPIAISAFGALFGYWVDKRFGAVTANFGSLICGVIIAAFFVACIFVGIATALGL